MLDYLTISASRKASRPRAAVGLRVSKDSTIETTDPIWLLSVERKINRLLQLASNWDGAGANPIDFESAMTALVFLLQNSLHDMPAPQVVPAANGGIQIEWHLQGSHLELLFAPTLPSSYYFCAADGKESEGEIDTEMPLVASLLRRLPIQNERFSVRR